MHVALSQLSVHSLQGPRLTAVVWLPSAIEEKPIWSPVPSSKLSMMLPCYRPTPSV